MKRVSQTKRGPEVKIRFDNRAQKDRITKAAKIRKWSFNRFMVEAGDSVAAATIQTEQLTTTTLQPASVINNLRAEG